MKYVLDSSVALKWVLPEADSDKASRLRDQFHNGLDQAHAPDVFAIEIGHALTRAERRLTIKAPHGWLLWQTIMLDCPSLSASIPLMPRAFEISSQQRIGIYDSLYVALAENEQCDLVTADTKMVNALRPFKFVRHLSSFP